MGLIKNSFIYLGSSVLSKGAPFLLLPFLTSYLQPSEFGVLAIFMVINALYGAFIGMAIHTNIAKNFFNKTKSDLALITGNAFFILFATTAFYFFVTLIVASQYNTLFSIPTNYLLVLPILSFTTMVNQVHLAVLRSEGRAYIFGAFEIINALFSVATTLIFLIYFRMGWISQVLGMATASLVLGVIGVGYLNARGYLNLSFRKAETISILILSIPLIPHVLGSVVIAVSDRLFIEQMVGLEAVALYTIGYSFGMVVSLFTDALIKAWSPWFYQQLVDSTHEQKLNIVKLTYLYLVSVFVLAYVISLLGVFILPYIVDVRYTGAAEYIWWITLGYAIHGVYKIFFPFLVHINKTGFLAFSTATAAAINIVLNYLFIQKFGALGAAYATIVSYSVSALFVFEYQRRNFPMPWLLKR
jgi:O-antigen/teichoic acid export membrane protein